MFLLVIMVQPVPTIGEHGAEMIVLFTYQEFTFEDRRGVLREVEADDEGVVRGRCEFSPAMFSGDCEIVFSISRLSFASSVSRTEIPNES